MGKRADVNNERADALIYCEAPECERPAHWEGYRHGPGWWVLAHVCQLHKSWITDTHNEEKS